MLQHENSRTLGSFVFEDILCHWGAVEEIVTDSGPAFVQAVEYLSKQYYINHICISSYNSRVNGVTLYKCLGKISDILHLNNENNQLERQARPPKDVPLDAQS